ncbi:hypothetical protein Tco_1285591 [Tanacetum coccineum]
MPKYKIMSTDKAALKEYDQKSTLYQTMNENKTFNRNPANHALYHAFIEALIKDENAMDKGVSDTVTHHQGRTARFKCNHTKFSTLGTSPEKHDKNGQLSK